MRVSLVAQSVFLQGPQHHSLRGVIQTKLESNVGQLAVQCVSIDFHTVR